MLCPYCHTKPRLVDSSYIYNGKSFGQIWLCSSWPICDAYVGVHPGTIKPLGSMANKKLRALRSQAHELFDVCWKEGSLTRTQAYVKLRNLMKIQGRNAHIGMFNEVQCLELIGKLQRAITVFE